MTVSINLHERILLLQLPAKGSLDEQCAFLDVQDKLALTQAYLDKVKARGTDKDATPCKIDKMPSSITWDATRDDFSVSMTEKQRKAVKKTIELLSKGKDDFPTGLTTLYRKLR